MSSLTLDPKSPFYSPLDPPFEWPELLQSSAKPIEYVSILVSAIPQFLSALQPVPHLNPQRRNYNNLPKEATRFHCPVPDCKNEFPFKESLKTHLIHIHYMEEADLKRTFPGLENPFPCPFIDCPKGYHHKPALKKHLFREHHMKETDLKGIIPGFIPKSEKPYPCVVSGCASAFRHKRDLNTHLKHKHPKKSILYQEKSTHI